MAMAIRTSAPLTLSSHPNNAAPIDFLRFSASPSSSSSSVFGSRHSIIRLVSSSSAQSRRARPPLARAMASSPSLTKKKVLIINTNSGGHAVIGFWLAKELASNGHAATIFTIGDESSDKMKKTPFSRFSELRELGVRTVWGNQADIGSVVGSDTFDVVLDNNGKDLDAVKPVADWAKGTGAQQFLFISSAGIYKTTDEPPHVEGDEVNPKAGHVGVEEYISGLSFSSWASFRPQYMIGSGNNKDCEEWFFDRIVRGREVPIPAPGMQVTNISHVKDLSSMLRLAVEKPEAANGTTFNAVSDRAVTFDGLVRLCAKAAGMEAKIVHYVPKDAGVDAKKAFPFRNMHFYAEPRAAKEKLGWKSSTDLPSDLKERFEEYIAIGRDKKDIAFDLDDKILNSLKTSLTV